MSVVVPSSLKWLAKKRSHITGQIIFAEKKLAKDLAALQKQADFVNAQHRELISLLKLDLEAIDRALRLHEIPVDPNLIRPTRVQSNPSPTQHGRLTRLIYRALADAYPIALSTTHITAYVKTAMGHELSKEATTELHERIRHRLRGLCRVGKVERAHLRTTNADGAWRLQTQKLPAAPVALIVPGEHPRRSGAGD